MPKRIPWLALAFLFLAACGGTTAAPSADAPSRSGRALPPADRLADPVDVADGVIQLTSIAWGFDTNSYAIVGPTGIVLVDTQFLPSEAERLVAAVERATGKRVVLAMVLHPNPDKFNGAEVLRRHGSRVVTSSQVLTHIPHVDEIRRRAFQARYRPDYPERMPRVDSFGDETTNLDVAGLHLRAHVLGAGCSDAHVVLEWNGHVFPGDLVSNGTHAWLELGYIDDWLSRMGDIEAIRPRRVHPGRGPSGGPELVARQREYLARVQELVRDAHPTLPVPQGALHALRARIETAYPSYTFAVFLDIGLAAVWRREAAHLGRTLP